MSSDPPPPSSESRERLQSFTGEVLSALVKAGESHARLDTKLDALDRQVATLGARQSSHTILLAVIALISQIVSSNVWRLGYAPRPASTYARPSAAPSASAPTPR